jgi:hypothetical protein
MKSLRIFIIILFLFTGCKSEDIPVVTTAEVTSVTQTSATCGGDVLSQGDAEVTSRGIYLGTSGDQAIIDTITVDSTGTGSFTCKLTDLEPGTDYYVKAFANNIFGTGYGDTVSFTTEPATLPEVITYSRIPVTKSTAKLYGEVLSDGESQLIEYGFCWSTSENPTLSDNCKTQDSDYRYFIATITNLEPGTKYFASAYATNHVGTAYGYIVSFSTCSEIPDTSFIGNWHRVSDPYDIASTHGKNRLEITTDSIFTMYDYYGEFYFSSSFNIRSNDEGYDTIYFTNPQAFYSYHLIELTDCNNLKLLNPFEWDIAGGPSYYTRKK